MIFVIPQKNDPSLTQKVAQSKSNEGRYCTSVSLTIYQAIFTGQQLCLHTLATPCGAQQNNPRSVRCIISVLHLQVGQNCNNRTVRVVNNLDYKFMNALSFMLIFECLYYKPCCYTGLHYLPFTNEKKPYIRK